MIETKTVETSQLQTLVAVAHTQSFSRAAEELRVTQSAISQSIKNLETKLGVTLFARSGKKVVMTLEGEKLYGTAKKYLISLEDTIQEIINDKAGMSGGVRIGSLTGISKSWLYHMCMEYAEQHPQIYMRFKLASSPAELVEDFERYLLDVIVVPEHDVPSLGQKLRLDDEHITLVCPKDPKTFTVDPDMDLKKFSELPVILFERGDSLFRYWCQKKFGDVPGNINKRLAVNSHGNMLAAVSKGLGIAVLPTHVLERSYYKDKVRTLGKDFEVFYKRTYLVYHQEAMELTRVRTLVDKIKELQEFRGTNNQFSSNISVPPYVQAQAQDQI